MNTFITTSPARQTAIRALAAVGFVALVGASLWLAVYSTRYVPTVVGRIGASAVYLGSIFTKAPEPSLSVVPTPTASSTPSQNVASSTISTTEGTSPIATKPATTKTVQPTAGQETSGTYQMGGATTTSTTPAGLPDFIVTINAIGYLATSSADSFVTSTSVPAGNRPAVRFTIKNIGGSAAGPWRWSASIPTQTAYIYQSLPQQPLNPGDSIDYTLGFDQANRGSDQTISISANFDRAVTESNTGNNNASAKITILGS